MENESNGPSPEARAKVAILSLLPHGDRTYLDDRELALLSGALTARGVDNDLVAAVVRDEGDVDALGARLEGYGVVVYERVWSVALIEALRVARPETIFVAGRGEHEIADPPADYWCRGTLEDELPRLVAFLVGMDARAPGRSFVRGADGTFAPLAGEDAPPPPRNYAPNLAPQVIGEAVLRARRSFSIVGNAGCPYQADARENPVYAGVTIPEGLGRGCAFCTTGNHYVYAPPEDTAARVLAEILHVRASAPATRDLVLKDQNPFGYLVPLLEGLAGQPAGGFRLLLETRADWFVKNRARFDRALAAARAVGVTIAPYLVGIESFSQPELDRFNKGIAARDNEAFLFALWDWKRRYPDVLDLRAAAFGFVLFTPWTSLDDLAQNHAAIVRTGLSKLRGKILTSWARLYPDTALYYLAERDGRLVDAWPDGDPSARHGYHPSQPWRFADPRVAALARAALVLTERTEGRDQDRLFALLLEHAARGAIDVDAIEAALHAPDRDPMRARIARVLAPADPLPGGYRLAHLAHEAPILTLTFDAPDRAPLQLVVSPRDEASADRETHRYAIRMAREPDDPMAREILDAFADALAASERPRRNARAAR